MGLLMPMTPGARAAASRVGALDLDPVAWQLMHPGEGRAGLSLAEADGDLELYRGFWVLVALHADEALVPTPRIDRVLHAHLLDVEAYLADCEHVFGAVLRHWPYPSPAEMAREFENGPERTAELFEYHFGLRLGVSDSRLAPPGIGHGACELGCGVWDHPPAALASARDTAFATSVRRTHRPRPPRPGHQGSAGLCPLWPSGASVAAGTYRCGEGYVSPRSPVSARCRRSERIA
jgi:hypothetical protein